MKTTISRRSALKTLATGAAIASVPSAVLPRASAAEAAGAKLKGNIHHSVSAWCYGNGSKAKMNFEEFCRAKTNFYVLEKVGNGPDEKSNQDKKTTKAGGGF